MKAIFWNAVLVALGATAASLLMVLTIVPAVGGVVEGNALVMSIACPLAIAFPASFYTFWQKKRLADTLEALRHAHDRLADTHAELAQAYARLSEKARRDDMTGLLNRESFFAALEAMRRRTDAGTLLIIDADHFKSINDTWGHQQGDAALLLICGAIRAGVRDADLVGRIGGEEFAVFLSGAGEEEAVVIAERIRAGVEQLRFCPGEEKSLPLSVSIGAARLGSHRTWTEMMREADRSLYEAKRRGRNRVVFEEPQSASA